MSRKTKLTYILIMNIPVALSIALAAQLVAIGKIIVPLLMINLLLAYVIAFFIGIFIPTEMIGVGFAKLFKVKPGLVFGLFVNLPINFIYVTIICIIMSYFNIVILQKLPIGAFIGGMIGMYPILFIVGYIVSFVANQPALNLAQKITGEKVIRE